MQNEGEHKKKKGGSDHWSYMNVWVGIIWFDLDMAGKKTKHIEKEPKAEKTAPKKENTSGDDWDIFTDTFKERLSQFIGLNQEVLELKGSVEESDQTDQINENKKRMADKVEQAATEILKE